MNKYDIYVGGQTVDQWGTFKRNKRDIINKLKYNNNEYILTSNMEGFYNKALIYQNTNNSNNYILVSYNTIVAELNNKKFKINGYYSITTAKHIDAFLMRFGLKKLSKKEILTIADTWQDCKNYTREV